MSMENDSATTKEQLLAEVQNLRAYVASFRLSERSQVRDLQHVQAGPLYSAVGALPYMPAAVGAIDPRFAMLGEALPNYVVCMLDVDGYITDWYAGTEQSMGYCIDEMIGQHFSCFYLPDQLLHGLPEQHLRQAAAVGRHNDEGWRVRRNNSLVWANIALNAVRSETGTLTGFMVLVHDLTEHRRVQQGWEQRLAEGLRDLARRRQAAERLIDILALVNSNHPLDDILAQLIRQLSQLLGADAGAIYWLPEPGGLLRVRVVHGMNADAVAIRVPADSGPIGLAVTQRRPVAASFELAAHAYAAGPEGDHQHASWEPLVTWYSAVLTVPVIVRDDVYGAIVLYQHATRAFSDEELQLAVTFANHVTIAIENARLFAIQQDTVTLEERQRLARELHDSVTQSLYAMKLFAEAAVRRIAVGDTATAAGHLGELRSMVQEALQEMRLLIFELRPPILEQDGLALAIQARLDAVEGRAGLRTEFTVAGDQRPVAATEEALYRVAQEALNNVLKHANARRIVVMLEQEVAVTKLSVTDDGLGFDPEGAANQGGWGLRGMKERIAQVGGHLTVESALGQGTTVRVEVGS